MSPLRLIGPAAASLAVLLAGCASSPPPHDPCAKPVPVDPSIHAETYSFCISSAKENDLFSVDTAAATVLPNGAPTNMSSTQQTTYVKSIHPETKDGVTSSVLETAVLTTGSNYFVKASPSTATATIERNDLLNIDHTASAAGDTETPNINSIAMTLSAAPDGKPVTGLAGKYRFTFRVVPLAEGVDFEVPPQD